MSRSSTSPGPDARARSDGPDGAGSGQLAGRYRLGAPLGGGVSGRVVAARDAWTGRDVAVKLTQDRASGLRREYELLSSLEHPNLVRAYDYGVDAASGCAFLVLDLLRGAPLEGPDGGRAPELFRDACRGLAALHRRGLVHGDLKPANLLVERRSDGGARVRLIDLGLAAPVGEVGPARGTPRYAAPEVLRGLPPTPRSDVYALVASFAEAFLGGVPGRDGATAKGALRGRSALVDLWTGWLAAPTEERPASAVALLEALGREGLAEPEADPGSAPWTGRSTELARLGAELAVPGARVLLRGPRGQGKSALLRELARNERLAGRRVVELRGADLAGAPDPAGLSRPALVVVDDLDACPAETGRAFAGRLREGGTPLLASAAGTGSPMDSAAEEGWRIVELGPLERADAERLVAALLPASPDRVSLAAKVAAETDGHPGFAVLASRALAGEPRALEPSVRSAALARALPPALAASWSERLERLDPAERALARAGAVLAEPAGADVWAQVAGEEGVAPRLERLVEDRWLRATLPGPEYAFASDALRRWLEEALDDGARTEAHRRAASARRHDPLGRASEARWRHALALGRAEEARSLAPAAARAALTRGDPERALEVAACAGCAPGDPAARAELAECRGDAHRARGRAAEALAAYEEALAAAPGAGEPRRSRKAAAALEALGDALAARERLDGVLARLGDVAGAAAEEAALALELAARLEFARGEPAAAEALLRRGLARLDGRAPGEASAMLWNDLGILAFVRGEPEEARSHHATALRIRRRTGDLDGEARSRTNLGNVLFAAGELERAGAEYRRALEIKRRLGNAASIALTASNLGEVEHGLGAFERAIELHREALAASLDVGDVRGEARARRSLAEARADAGRLGDAWRDAATAVSIGLGCGARDGDLATALGTLARIERLLGRVERSAETADEAVELAGRGGGKDLARARAVRALLGGPGAAEELEGSLAELERAGERLAVLDLALEGALAALAAGEPQRAAARLARVRGRAAGIRGPWLEARLAHAAGALAWRRGEAATASRELHRAHRGAERLGAPELVWRVRAELAGFHAAEGRRERALMWLNGCLGVFRSVVEGLDDPELEASYLEAPERIRVLETMEAWAAGGTGPGPG